MATLAGLSTRLGRLLDDPSGVIYDAATLEEALRTALGRYNQALGAQATLQGLDGEAETSLPQGDEEILLYGAASFAVGGRCLKRAESFNLDQNVPATLRERGQEMARAFEGYLERRRVAKLHQEGVSPLPEQGWGLDAWEEQA